MSDNIRITKNLKKYIDLYKKIYGEIISVKYMTDAEIINAIVIEWSNYNPLLKGIENDL